MRNDSLALFPALLLPLLAACGPFDGDSGAAPDIEISDFSVTMSSDVPTVGIAEWTSADASIGRLHIVVDGDERVTPWESEAIASHSNALFGIPAATTFEVWAEARNGDGGVGLSEPVTMETGGTPPNLPVVSATLAVDDLGGFMILPLIGADLTTMNMATMPGAVVMIDGEGRTVWWSMHVGEQISSAELSRDGTTVLALSHQKLMRIAIDGSISDVATVPDGHHDLAELPDGTIGVLTYDLYTTDTGAGWQTTSIHELQADGTLVQTWSLADHIDELGIVPGSGPIWSEGDLDHGNALTYDADADQWLVGVTGIRGILRIDRSSSDTEWWIGQDDLVTLAIDSPSTYTLHHGFDLLGDSMLLFVNETNDSVCARVVELDLDAAAGLASQVNSYVPSSCQSSTMLGQVRRLTPDVVLANFSTAATADLLDSGLGLQASFEVGDGMGFGYGDWLPDLSEPVTR